MPRRPSHPATTRAERDPGNPARESRRDADTPAARDAARRAAYPRPCGTDRWRRKPPGAHNHGLSHLYADPGHHPRQRISVGHRHGPAGRNEPGPHVVGRREARSGAGGADGHGYRPTQAGGHPSDVDRNAAQGDPAHDRLLRAQPGVYALRPLSGAGLAHRHRRSGGRLRDRKSTRLNSSHVKSSYAVFCSKTKKNKNAIYKVKKKKEISTKK